MQIVQNQPWEYLHMEMSPAPPPPPEPVVKYLPAHPVSAHVVWKELTPTQVGTQLKPGHSGSSKPSRATTIGS